MLCEQFLEAKEKSHPHNIFLLTADQRQWLDFQSFVLNTKPKHIRFQRKNKCSLFKRTTESSFFEVFLILCIIGNIVTLSLNYEGEPDYYTKILEIINYFFTGVFIFEACLKLIAFGVFHYFSSAWNIFDFTIALSSLTEIFVTKVMQNSTNSINILRIGPQVIRIFRILRVLRVLKLIKRLETLKKLIATLISAIPSIANVGVLYFLVFYIYAIIGVFLFKDVKSGTQIDDYNNFFNAGYAIVLCFKMVTGENWWQFMFDCYKVPPYCSPLKDCGSRFFIDF